MRKTLIVFSKEMRRIFTDGRFLLSIVLPSAVMYIVFVIVTKNSNDPTKVSSSMGLFAPVFAYLLIGGPIMEIVPSSFAGEKEAKTIGFTLTAPVSNFELIIGKIGALIASGFVLSLVSIGAVLASMYKSIGSLSLTGLGVFFLFLLAFSVAVLLVSGCFLVSLLCKTAKEAQGYCFGVVFLGVVLSFLVLRVDVNSLWIPYVPVVNLSCSISAVMFGIENVLSVLLSVLLSLIYSSILIWASISLSKKESILS